MSALKFQGRNFVIKKCSDSHFHSLSMATINFLCSFLPVLGSLPICTVPDIFPNRMIVGQAGVVVDAAMQGTVGGREPAGLIPSSP